MFLPRVFEVDLVAPARASLERRAVGVPVGHASGLALALRPVWFDYRWLVLFRDRNRFGLRHRSDQVFDENRYLRWEHDREVIALQRLMNPHSPVVGVG